MAAEPVGYPEQLVTTGPHTFHGLIDWLQYLYALMNQVFAHLFQTADNIGLVWQESHKQWQVAGNVPAMTEKGADIVGAVMTMLHNGLIFVAQLTTLLPYEAVPVGIPT